MEGNKKAPGRELEINNWALFECNNIALTINI